MKKCTKCKILKPLSDYHKSGDGFKSRCKECIKLDNKERYLKNKLHIQKINKEYRLNNKEKINKINREYYHNNKEKCNNKSKRWQNKNKEHIRKWVSKRNRERKENEPLYKLKTKMRSDIHKVLKNKTKCSNEYLKCDYNILINHLNNNPYGFTYGTKGIDIDHIIPLSSAKNEEELLGLLIYTNLQLLPSYYNRHIKKDNIFNKKEFEKWLKNN
jgi:hypothetical protein